MAYKSKTKELDEFDKAIDGIYYLKYCFPGTDDNSIIVTIGYYEGINELFLKISR